MYVRYKPRKIISNILCIFDKVQYFSPNAEPPSEHLAIFYDTLVFCLLPEYVGANGMDQIPP